MITVFALCLDRTKEFESCMASVKDTTVEAVAGDWLVCTTSNWLLLTLLVWWFLLLFLLLFELSYGTPRCLQQSFTQYPISSTTVLVSVDICVACVACAGTFFWCLHFPFTLPILRESLASCCGKQCRELGRSCVKNLHQD